MNMSHEFDVLALLLIDTLNGTAFRSAWLNIQMPSEVISINGRYIDGTGEDTPLPVRPKAIHFDAVAEIKKNTTTHTLKHSNWNKAKFTIYPDGKFDMEYKWDQALQDQIDRLNNAF